MNDQCKHGACNCSGSEVRADGFCSDACKEGSMSGGKCACGHRECADGH